MRKKGILLAAAVLFPLSIYAADNPTVQDSFKNLDKNQDGYISQQEAKADKKLTEDWSKADSNKDGKIEQSEFSAFEEGMESKEMPSKSSEQHSEEPDHL